MSRTIDVFAILGAIWVVVGSVLLFAVGAIFNALSGMANSIIGGAPPSRVLLIGAGLIGWAAILAVICLLGR